MAIDRNLGDVANLYTKGIVLTEKGTDRVSRILVDAGSVINLMPIHLLKFIGAKLRKAGGMVIRTATNALAKIAYCADIRITIADVPCDLRVYSLPEEYKPTYPLLLSRRWLQAVKAEGDYASGEYYIMSIHGTRVRIPSDRSSTLSPQRHRPPVSMVMSDNNTKSRTMSTMIKNKSDYQQAAGENAFRELVRIIMEESCEDIGHEEEEEEDGDGSSEDSEN